MNTITTKELRLKLPKIKKAVDMGESFVLVYRSRPFAELRPLQTQAKRSRSGIDVTNLSAFGMWSGRVKHAGGTNRFLSKLRKLAWA